MVARSLVSSIAAVICLCVSYILLVRVMIIIIRTLNFSRLIFRGFVQNLLYVMHVF
jgi:hypothetical protein